MPRRLLSLGLLFLGVLTVCQLPELRAEPGKAEAKFKLVTLKGRVGWLSEAIQRRHGVKEVPESAERVAVLETADGELYPLVDDVRGRAFRRDDRLRKIDLELVVRKYEGSPFVQVIRVFELQDDGKYEIDYWCEICSIAMFELKDCECCQGPIKLRKTKVETQ